MDKKMLGLLEQLCQKQDIMNALLLRMVPKNNENLSLKDQLRILNSLGIRPVDMSRITGKKQSYINKELVYIRKEK